MFLLSLAVACDAPPQTSSLPVPLAFYRDRKLAGECHAPQFELWQRSHHELAMQEATPDTVLGEFSGVRVRVFRCGEYIFSHEMEITWSALTTQTVNSRSSRSNLTFGVTPLQQYLVEMPNGHVQPLPVALGYPE